MMHSHVEYVNSNAYQVVLSTDVPSFQWTSLACTSIVNHFRFLPINLVHLVTCMCGYHWLDFVSDVSALLCFFRLCSRLLLVCPVYTRTRGVSVDQLIAVWNPSACPMSATVCDIWNRQTVQVAPFRRPRRRGLVSNYYKQRRVGSAVGI